MIRHGHKHYRDDNMINNKNALDNGPSLLLNLSYSVHKVKLLT